MPLKQFISELTRRKHLLHVAAIAEGNDFKRTLTALSLTSLGVGSVVGAGIFVITGQAAAIAAGPALSISFVLSAISCFFCGMCYAELASAIPVSGSAYTFTYIAVGEFAAWTVAVCLVLENLISTSAVSVGWSGSLKSFLEEFDIFIPSALSSAPIQIEENGGIALSGSLINLPAAAINLTLTVVLCLGVKESTTFNNVFVGVKLAVLAVFIAYGAYFATANSELFRSNLSPFIPENTGPFGHFGISGIFRGAGMVFFSYIGFDTICAMAQECKQPARDMPIALLSTLALCTVLYVTVTIVLTGLVKYTELGVDDPVPHALHLIDAPPVIRYLVDIGAISGLTSVCLVSFMSVPRLLYSLSNDGLLPKVFGEIHERYKTPVTSTIVCGAVATLIGGLLPLDVLGELVSVGTLMAFMMVCYSVIAFRKRHPDYPRPFTVPLVPYFPLAGIALCGMQMVLLPVRTLVYYLLLQSPMLGYYLLYGRHSSVAKHKIELRKSRAGSPIASRTASLRSPSPKGVAPGPTAPLSSFPNVASQLDDSDNPLDDFTDYDSEEDYKHAKYGLRRTLPIEGSPRPSEKRHRMKGEEWRRYDYLIGEEQL